MTRCRINRWIGRGWNDEGWSDCVDGGKDVWHGWRRQENEYSGELEMPSVFLS
jgi:hypothetical protein